MVIIEICLAVFMLLKQTLNPRLMEGKSTSWNNRMNINMRNFTY